MHDRGDVHLLCRRLPSVIDTRPTMSLCGRDAHENLPVCSLF
jgi:hypothetical protein